MNHKRKSQLIVALDVNTLAEVRVLVDQMVDYVDVFKVGSQLFTSCGPAAVKFIEARGKKVFLDLKFHDIPNTVANAVTAAVGLTVMAEGKTDSRAGQAVRRQGVYMYTLHTCGGLDMMKAAVEAGAKQAQELGVAKPLAVGVTVLTSEAKRDNITSLVLERALLAEKAGLDGVVASCDEAPLIRKEFGKDFIVVTPGIRPAGSDVGDQKRVATPKNAVLSGSNFLVVGRPVVQASNPYKAAKEISIEIENI